MSYILDALKKSQAEQAGDAVSLRMDQSTTRGGVALWIVALVLVGVFNLGVLLWIFVFDADDPVVAAAAPATQDAPTARRTPLASVPAVEPIPATATPAPAAIERVALRDLPAREQTLYNGFIYSSHIYTDDPSLCAIVVDGQRLKAGDAFKGLRVVAVTETGVVFEETRRGVTREVSVSVLEIWES